MKKIFLILICCLLFVVIKVNAENSSYNEYRIGDNIYFDPISDMVIVK